MEINEYTERFLIAMEYLKDNNIVRSNRQFAIAIETAPQSLHHSIKRRRNVTVENIGNLVKIYNVSSRFILLGEYPILDGVDIVKIRKEGMCYHQGRVRLSYFASRASIPQSISIIGDWLLFLYSRG